MDLQNGFDSLNQENVFILNIVGLAKAGAIGFIFGLAGADAIRFKAIKRRDKDGPTNTLAYNRRRQKARDNINRNCYWLLGTEKIRRRVLLYGAKLVYLTQNRGLSCLFNEYPNLL